MKNNVPNNFIQRGFLYRLFIYSEDKNVKFSIVEGH
jgi:hypothetical protein